MWSLMCRGWLTMFLLSRQRPLGVVIKTYINNISLLILIDRRKHVYRGYDNTCAS